MSREALRSALGRFISRGWEEGGDEGEFTSLALRIFRYQVNENPVYGAFVRNRGIDPHQVSDWAEIPAVPARAFKEFHLFCGDPATAEATFLTSGTTGVHRGAGGRGRHPVRDLSLYRESLLAMAGRYLHPAPGNAALSGPYGAQGRSSGPVRVIALLPTPEAHPESSLVYMVEVLREAWDDGKGGFFASADWSLDFPSLDAALSDAARDSAPVILAGTAFGFVHLLDELAGSTTPPLPPGSVIMETGGYKGRSREVPRGELYRSLSECLGVPIGRIVNEYGMTEMLSQFYEPVLEGLAPSDVAGRWHLAPPWVRTRILDPAELSPVLPGKPGLLCHLDLANLDSVSMILTEDWGVAVEGGFRVLGRLLDAEPRGCSLSMEELMRVRKGGAVSGSNLGVARARENLGDV